MISFKKIIIFIFIFLVVLFALFFLYDKFFVKEQQLPILESDEELKNKIGQMLLIGFRGTDVKEDSEIFNIIKDIKVGGVVLFDYDIPSNSFPRNIVDYNQTKKLIFDLQKYSETPLFIAVDAEGGKVNRLKSDYGFYNIVSAKEMVEKNITDEQSKKLAEQLSDLRFNMNLAPVVDLNINPKNPIIGALGRSFSDDEQVVTNNAEIFIKNHIEKNIITVEKHFPGHGSSTSDSHLGLVDVTDVFNEQEFLPYKKLNDKNLLDAVMTAHTINKNIDKDYPASLSSNFLQNILRDQIGFDGVIISDDMQMGAISKNFNFEESIILAINAGTDIISLMNNSSDNYDSQMAYKARDVIFWAVKEGKISREKIEESYNRIIELKRKYGVLN
jgi:beta-N-acetylhexosaminidase